MKYLSVAQYAKMRGVTRGAVNKRLSKGTLKGTRIGKQWVIGEKVALKDMAEKIAKGKGPQ